MHFETTFKTKIIKTFLILSFIVCWLSISTSFDDLLILEKNQPLELKNIINFFRHSAVYLSLLFLIFIIFFFKNIFFSKKNRIFHFLIIYLLIQLPGLFFSDNSIKNISYIISSLTITITILFSSHFFSSKEKRIFIYISIIILLTVWSLTFVPHFIEFLKGGNYFYGFYGDSDIFFEKDSPRSSGLARTSLIILLFIGIIEYFLFRKKIIFFTFIKILFLTCILFFQSRTIIFLTIFSYFFIFIFENRISIRNFFKFICLYFIIPLLLMTILTYVNEFQSFKKKNIEISSNQLSNQFSAFIEDTTKKKKHERLRTIDKDFSSGRFMDWEQIIDSVSNENIFYGYGSQADRYLIQQTASNGLIYAYAATGIFGLFFYILFSVLIFYHTLKIIVFSYKKQLNNHIYCLIIFVIMLRSLLETSYAVFSIDFVVMITILIKLNNFNVKISDIKKEFK